MIHGTPLLGEFIPGAPTVVWRASGLRADVAGRVVFAEYDPTRLRWAWGEVLGTEDAGRVTSITLHVLGYADGMKAAALAAARWALSAGEEG